MNLYGLCPAQEEVCLVICKECGRVVKVATFSRHCGKLNCIGREFLNACTGKKNRKKIALNKLVKMLPFLATSLIYLIFHVVKISMHW
jgi:hypothetical protein